MEEWTLDTVGLVAGLVLVFSPLALIFIDSPMAAWNAGSSAPLPLQPR